MNFESSDRLHLILILKVQKNLEQHSLLSIMVVVSDSMIEHFRHLNPEKAIEFGVTEPEPIRVNDEYDDDNDADNANQNVVVKNYQT